PGSHRPVRPLVAGLAPLLGVAGVRAHPLAARRATAAGAPRARPAAVRILGQRPAALPVAAAGPRGRGRAAPTEAHFREQVPARRRLPRGSVPRGRALFRPVRPWSTLPSRQPEDPATRLPALGPGRKLPRREEGDARAGRNREVEEAPGGP